MEWWQALLLGALQGVSELFPISSLAHTILIPALLGWPIDQTAGSFLAFVVALHLATAVALLIFFWRDWAEVIRAYGGSLQRRQLVYDRTSKFAWLLVAGTIAVGFVGLVFEKPVQRIFDDPRLYWIVALLLIVNGGLMLVGETVRRRAAASAVLAGAPAGPPPRSLGAAATHPADADAALARAGRLRDAPDLSFGEGAAVGAAQILALVPGISRSGITIVAGLFAGLTHEAAARFAFMLATPVIGLAALLKVPDLFRPAARGVLAETVPAALLAGVTAYLSVRFLMRYFRTERLSPFGYYCAAFGLLALVVLLLRH